MKLTTIILQTISCLLVTLMLCSCSVTPQPRTFYKEQLSEQGELFLFLQPLPQEMLPLRFTISEISVISEQGNVVPLLTSTLDIRGTELVGVQKRLVSATLPPGRYQAVSMTIDQATIATEAGEVGLLPPEEPLRVALEFAILRGRSQPLFLFLSPEFLVIDGYRFTPRFALGRPVLPPRNFLGFVSNSTENLVTVFNKRTLEVVHVIHTGLGPKGMALDQKNGILYVATAGDDAIELYSIASMERIGRIRQHFGDEPEELALSPDGLTLVSANTGSATVSIIDTRSRSERGRLNSDPDPAWVVVGKDEQRAYVLHTLSGTISVIDFGRRNLVTSIPLDESPLRGALSRDGEALFIIPQYANDLLVVDVSSFSITDRIFIGSGSSSLTVDPKSNLVYVGKKSGEIAVVDPSKGIFIDSFSIDRDAGFMVIDGEENVLFVLSEADNKVHKINLVSKRRRGEMRTEAGGHALAVMGGL